MSHATRSDGWSQPRARRAGEWLCACGFSNYPKRKLCFKCDKPRPSNGSGGSSGASDEPRRARGQERLSPEHTKYYQECSDERFAEVKENKLLPPNQIRYVERLRERARPRTSGGEGEAISLAEEAKLKAELQELEKIQKDYGNQQQRIGEIQARLANGRPANKQHAQAGRDLDLANAKVAKCEKRVAEAQQKIGKLQEELKEANAELVGARNQAQAQLQLFQQTAQKVAPQPSGGELAELLPGLLAGLDIAQSARDEINKAVEALKAKEAKPATDDAKPAPPAPPADVADTGGNEPAQPTQPEGAKDDDPMSGAPDEATLEDFAKQFEEVGQSGDRKRMHEFVVANANLAKRFRGPA